MRIRRLRRSGSDETRRRLVIWNPVPVLGAGGGGIASVAAVRISGFIDQIANAIFLNVTVLQTYSLSGIRTGTQCQIALLTRRCIMNEYRGLPRQHIVRVALDPALPAFSQVSGVVAVRRGPRLCADAGGCCRHYCRRRSRPLGLVGVGAAGHGWALGAGLLLPVSGLCAEDGAGGLFVGRVVGLGAVFGDPAGQFLRGVRRPGGGCAVVFVAGDTDGLVGGQCRGSGAVVTWYSRNR